MPAPNRPDLVLPDCPRCDEQVTKTELDSAVLAFNPVGDWPTKLMFASSVPEGWKIVGGDPDRDRLTLHPCGHELVGVNGWAYNVEAVNRTWPHLTITLAVVVPAAAAGTEVPATFSKTTTVTVDELLGDLDGMHGAIARHLHSTAALAAAMVARAGADG